MAQNAGVTADDGPQDTDFARVSEVLQGARRHPGDPDLELARLLNRLVDATEETVLGVLQELVRDANPN